MATQNTSRNGDNADYVDGEYQPLPPICGLRFKQIMKDKGFSEPRLAAAAGVGRNTIANIRKGKVARESSVQALCKFLNIQRSDIELKTGARSELEYVIPPPEEWIVTNQVSRPVNTDNGLTIRIAKLKHKQLDRFGRGKLYEMVHIEPSKRINPVIDDPPARLI